MKKEKVQAATCHNILNSEDAVKRDNVCVLAAGLKSAAISSANVFFAECLNGADPDQPQSDSRRDYLTQLARSRIAGCDNGSEQ